MSLYSSLLTALDNLRVNKFRSLLTMLGVIIGVSAVIVMVSIVEGARAHVVREFEQMGARLILVTYQPDPKEQRQETRLDSLMMEDVRAIRAECDLIQSLSAETSMGGEEVVRLRDREIRASITGAQPDYCHIHSAAVAQGRFFGAEDMEGWAKVCVIGWRVRRELFGDADPVGMDILVRGVSVTVVGVLEPKGRTMEGDLDRAVLLPLTTVQKRFLGRERVGILWAQPYEAARIEPAMDQIWQCLMRRYDNAPGFRVDTLASVQNAVGRVLTLFGLVLGGIAGLALLVGGIGIMNIMLVSVTERTREIGLRKAIGAKRRDILWQFLMESMTLSGAGGLIGIALGAGVALIISQFSRLASRGESSDLPGFTAYLPLWAVVGAFAFSACVGVFFGLYPAIRASRLNPIQALRHE